MTYERESKVMWERGMTSSRNRFTEVVIYVHLFAKTD